MIGRGQDVSGIRRVLSALGACPTALASLAVLCREVALGHAQRLFGELIRPKLSSLLGLTSPNPWLAPSPCQTGAAIRVLWCPPDSKHVFFAHGRHDAPTSLLSRRWPECLGDIVIQTGRSPGARCMIERIYGDLAIAGVTTASGNAPERPSSP